MGITYCKAGAALRKRLRYAQNCSLGARVLRRSPFFGELPSYGGFSFGASTEMKIPPKAYFSPAKCRKIVPPSLFYGIFAVIFAKAYWGKNKTVGIFEASERHPPAPIQAVISTNRAEASPCGSPRRGSRDELGHAPAPSNWNRLFVNRQFPTS